VCSPEDGTLVGGGKKTAENGARSFENHTDAQTGKEKLLLFKRNRLNRSRERGMSLGVRGEAEGGPGRRDP